MKIALCLYGHVREFERVFSSLEKYFIRPFQPVIYTHLWTDLESVPFNKYDINHPFWSIYYSKEFGGLQITKSYADAINQRLNTRISSTCNFDKCVAYQDARKQCENIISRWWMPDATLKNWWAQNECMKMLDSDKNHWFDVVVISRIDIFYENYFRLDAVVPNEIIVPQSCTTARPNDFWACGTKESLKIWASRFERINTLDMNNLPDEPTKFLSNVLEEHGIKWDIRNIPLNVLNRY